MIRNINDTHFLRAVAIVFIVNSHLDMFYPKQFFASGGMIGNSLFFMLSVFGLYLSEKKNNRSFKEYMSRRIERIYPSVWVTLVLVYIPYRVITGEYSAENTLQYFGLFFFPPFWFLQAIMFFYLFEFFIIKRYSPRNNLLMICLGSIFYLYYYLNFLDLSAFSISEFPFRIIFFFNITLFGIFLSSRNDKITSHGIRDLFLCATFFAVIYLHKYLMIQNLFQNIQIIQHAAVFPFLFYSLKLARSGPVQKIMEIGVSGRPIRFLSKHTLEIYLAHTCLRKLFVDFNIIFPLNIFLFISASLFSAFLIKRISKYLSLSIAGF